jgi:purine nucleosidase
MRKILFDCDPGVDDATALFLAFAARDALDLVGITTVAGNASLEATTRNARIVRQMAGREDVPIYAGCASPLARTPILAEDFHGPNGLGPLPDFTPNRREEPGHAVPFIVETLRRSQARSVTIVLTGPGTNLAAALAMEPDIAPRIQEIAIMGGARREGGNITPSAEYNIFADPHAAAAVFACGAPLTVFGLDVTHQVRCWPLRIAAFQEAGGAVPRAIAALMSFSSAIERGTADEPGAPLHDPCPVAYLLKPDLFRFAPCHIAAETHGMLTFGHTAVDFREKASRPFNARWAHRVDAQGLFSLLLDRVRTL